MTVLLVVAMPPASAPTLEQPQVEKPQPWASKKPARASAAKLQKKKKKAARTDRKLARR
jgi:hypothetical protein